MTMTAPRRYRARHTISKMLAAHIRERYTTCYRRKAFSLGKPGSSWRPGPQWDGGEHRFKRYPDHWMRCAGFFLERQLPTAEYVYFVMFEENPRGLPSPMALMDKAMPHAFNTHEKYGRTRRLQRHREQLESQMSLLSSDVYENCELVNSGLFDMTRNQLQRVSLLDRNLAISPLLRYCIAVQSGLRDIERMFFEEAASQYVCESRYYDEVWQDLLPEDFRPAAMELFGGQPAS